MSLNQIVTPLDSAVLETKEQYKTYFRIVTHAFDQLVTSIAKENICTDLEATFVKQYCELLTYSLEAFRIKYLFDEDEKMRIDLTESGFPNYLEFRYLFNDLELRDEYIGKLPKIETVKAEFLETLLNEKRSVSERKLQQAASIIYYSSVKQQFIFRRFVQGKIQELTHNAAPQYMVSWSFYDVTYNRPFICFMYFNLHKVALAEVRDEIYSVLEQTADRDMNVEMMAYAIDKKLTYVFPKRIKKFGLGPLHSVFAKDKMETTHAILSAIVSKTLDLPSYAISLRKDEAVSTSEFKEGNFFNKQVLQLWENTKPKNYLLCSHRVMQTLYDNIPETLHGLAQDPIEIPALKLN